MHWPQNGRTSSHFTFRARQVKQPPNDRVLVERVWLWTPLDMPGGMTIDVRQDNSPHGKNLILDFPLLGVAFHLNDFPFDEDHPPLLKDKAG